MEKELKIYQAENGAIALKLDSENETIWGTRMQMGEIFGVNPQAISKHLQNIYKEGELQKNATSSKMELVQDESGRKVKRQVDFYNLDAIISVGYRINSKQGTNFRIWATQTLKQHITKGYTINQKILEKNKQQFLHTLEDLKILTQNTKNLETKDVLSLIQSFSSTFFNLENFDKNNFPKSNEIVEIFTSAKELEDDLKTLKKELLQKGEATDLFAQEKKQGSLKGIYGTVFQSVFGQDAYPTTEDKAAHLLYFIVKNHPFNDGNKRSGAFAFIWLLHKANYNFTHKISPETLTTLTLLIATSLPEEKDKMIGLVLLLLKD
ncbi:RhuM family protein [Polaribacter sp. Hel_I_88]|uniref:RhuM family protein n=1 Tax=Polaribacter sp. Hel_I_88 TaxID=1250006 RepID=UPI00056087DB|nr:RhuM family protein [Polaribacter sp. Hel_I_88]